MLTLDEANARMVCHLFTMTFHTHATMTDSHPTILPETASGQAAHKQTINHACKVT